MYGTLSLVMPRVHALRVTFQGDRHFTQLVKRSVNAPWQVAHSVSALLRLWLAVPPHGSGTWAMGSNN